MSQDPLPPSHSACSVSHTESPTATHEEADREGSLPDTLRIAGNIEILTACLL